jgi:hypothetical protein
MSTEVVFSDIGRMDLIKILNEEIRRHKHDE